MKTGVTLLAVLFAVFMMAGCGTGKDAAFMENSRMDESEKMAEGVTPASPSTDKQYDNLETDRGIIAEQVMNGADGAIHYSYYLPENYDKGKSYPMMVVMHRIRYDVVWRGIFRL